MYRFNCLVSFLGYFPVAPAAGALTVLLADADAAAVADPAAEEDAAANDVTCVWCQSCSFHADN